MCVGGGCLCVHMDNDGTMDSGKLVVCQAVSLCLYQKRPLSILDLTLVWSAMFACVDISCCFISRCPYGCHVISWLQVLHCDTL